MTGPDRLPPIPPEQWTEDQRRYAQEIIDGPRKGLISPFIPSSDLISPHNPSESWLNILLLQI